MKKHTDTTRRDFLKTAALAGLGFGLANLAPPTAKAAPTPATARSATDDISATRPRPPGQKPVYNLTTPPIEKVRVAVIGLGQRGASLLNDLLNIEFVEVVALCDLRKNIVEKALAKTQQRRATTPKTFSEDKNAWQHLVEMDGIDVVYIATPWEWHTTMAIKTMESGKHAFLEVAAAVTVDECWQLVDASERTQRHCPILENCCYGENELFVLNMTRNGIFGDLTHAECAYIHDLRRMLFSLGTEGDWRREYHKILDGNLYPTHGLGPVCQYLDIGRGDQLKFIVSVSSPERGLTKWLREKNPNNGRHKNEKYICGDINTSIIKTQLGRSIMIQHDVISPRPYSRINALSGTGATFFDFPARLAIDNPKQYSLDANSGHGWLKQPDMRKMREKFTHPLWNSLKERAKGSGHGGMDFVMSYRLLDCIRKGITPDMTVYDAALWSSIIELSSKSVETGSTPITIPDFTRGDWKNTPSLGIATT